MPDALGSGGIPQLVSDEAAGQPQEDDDTFDAAVRVWTALSEASERESRLGSRRYRSRSKRSRVITLAQAAMKSPRNASCPSSAA